MQVAMGGDGISSALYAIHHPGLTAHFGGDPACENGNQPGRAHPQGKAQEGLRLIQTLAVAQPQRQRPKQDHQHAESGHQAK